MEFDQWISELEKRHLADLRIAEVTRALRALSSAYVERRHTRLRSSSFGGQAVGRGPLGSAGKRAAFALFYAPLHFLAASHVIGSLDGAIEPSPSAILDVGCGTGAAGAASASAAGGRADEWRFAVDLPPLLRTLDKAAGLNHRELTVRSLWLPGS